MRKIILSLFFIIIAFAANAQYRTVLVQDFNNSCASPKTFPSDSDWIYYNPITSTETYGTWQCTAVNGRWGTPGIECTGTWGTPSMYNLDTSYLISPALNLSGYTGGVYLEFDTKTTNIELGARLTLMVGLIDTLFGRSPEDSFDLTPSLSPVFTSGDSSDWVTHEVDLTPFKSLIPLYLAFRYTSPSTSGSIWYLDNIHTTTFPIQASHIIQSSLPLIVVGNSSNSQITLSFEAQDPGPYHITVYDIICHKVHEEDVDALPGKTTYTINGLNLHSGMYIIKMSNGDVYGMAKTIVQ